MSKKIKVNFTMPTETKEFLDEINDATIPYKPNSRSEIIEKILNFDDDAAQIFLEIFKYKNKKKYSNQQYLKLSDGGIILSQDLMIKIILDLNIQNLVSNETPKTVEERFLRLERGMMTLKGEIREMQNKLEYKFEPLLTNLEVIENVAMEMQETNTSQFTTSAKLALISDQELLEAITEIIFKKLKDKETV